MIVGIDPGLSGAIALLDDNGQLRDVADMPVVDRAVSASLLYGLFADDWRDRSAITAAVVEEVAAMPKQGVASTFKFGQSHGVVLGVVAGLGLPLVRVRPAVWKKAMGLSADKERSRRLAIETWPTRAEWFARRKDEGRAEAALLALWHLQKGQQP